MEKIENDKELSKITRSRLLGSGKDLETLETSALDDVVYHPNTEETIKEFESVYKIPIFHHYVCNKDGYNVMEIFYNPDAKPFRFFVHYHRFESSGAKLRYCTCFQGFTSEQIGMAVFAYSEEEYWKFEKAFIDWIRKNSKRWIEDDG